MLPFRAGFGRLWHDTIEYLIMFVGLDTKHAEYSKVLAAPVQKVMTIRGGRPALGRHYRIFDGCFVCLDTKHAEYSKVWGGPSAQSDKYSWVSAGSGTKLLNIQ